MSQLLPITDLDDRFPGYFFDGTRLFSYKTIGRDSTVVQEVQRELKIQKNNRGNRFFILKSHQKRRIIFYSKLKRWYNERTMGNKF